MGTDGIYLRKRSDMRGGLRAALMILSMFCVAELLVADDGQKDGPTNGTPGDLVSLLEVCARVQIDITERGDTLRLNVHQIEELKAGTMDAKKCNTFVTTAKEHYTKYDSQMLREDLKILEKLEVPSELEKTHGVFVSYLKAAIAVEAEASSFFGSFSFEDASVIDPKGRRSLKPPKQTIDSEKMLPFKEKQKALFEATTAWNDHWKGIVNVHGAELKQPKSWDAFVLRVSKANTKKKK